MREIWSERGDSNPGPLPPQYRAIDFSQTNSMRDVHNRSATVRNGSHQLRANIGQGFPWWYLIGCLAIFAFSFTAITAYRNAEAGGSYVKTVRHVKDQARLVPEVMVR